MFSLRVALAFAVLLLALCAATVLAADPTPAASGFLIDPLDPRAGSGANQVGAPLVALVAVVVIGASAAVVAALYVRVTSAR